MRRFSWIAMVLALVGLGCAANDVGGTGAGLGGTTNTDVGDGSGECLPYITTPLMDVATGTIEVGQLAISFEGDEVAFYLSTADGWKLDDHEIWTGLSLPLAKYPANHEPAVSGAELRVDLAAAGALCTDLLKVRADVTVVRDGETLAAAAVGDSEWMKNVDGVWVRESWYDFYQVCLPCEQDGCRLTQGFWKTHPLAWPVETLELGGVVYDKSALLALLWTPTRGDGSMILAHQLIAAMLNVENGAADEPAIADAQAWLVAHADRDGRLPFGVKRGAAKVEASAIGDALAFYNQTNHCE